jgi:hypothetical protein
MCVYDVKPGLPGNQLFLHAPGQVIPDFISTVRCIEQERASLDQRSKHVVAFKKHRLMARNEVRLTHQIGRMNRLRTKSQMRNSDRSRLLGIVNEVSLRLEACIFRDNLDRIFVGTDRAIRAQSV